MVYREKRFEYKKKYLIELSKLPDTKTTARQFLSQRITKLKIALKDPTVSKSEKKTIKNIIEIYLLAQK
jgi:hypothetical protein